MTQITQKIIAQRRLYGKPGKVSFGKRQKTRKHISAGAMHVLKSYLNLHDSIPTEDDECLWELSEITGLQKEDIVTWFRHGRR